MYSSVLHSVLVVVSWIGLVLKAFHHVIVVDFLVTVGAAGRPIDTTAVAAVGEGRAVGVRTGGGSSRRVDEEFHVKFAVLVSARVPEWFVHVVILSRVNSRLKTKM